MSKFIFGVCCGIMIVVGFYHVAYLKRINAQPDEE